LDTARKTVDDLLGQELHILNIGNSSFVLLGDPIYLLIHTLGRAVLNQGGFRL
jgi:hypothetical protein